MSLSLQCFCAGFPDACPTYELAKQQRRHGFDGMRDECGSAASWEIVESVGCGRRVLSSPPGFAGGRWQYDEATLELVAAELYSDIGFGPCGSYRYRAGEVASCDAASVCSLCDDRCAPACSMEAYASDHFGPVVYEEWVQNALAMCPYIIDGEPRPTLTRGCGAATLSTKYGEATFAEETKTATFVRWVSADKCGGEWGEPPPVCDEQVACSLCEDGCP